MKVIERNIGFFIIIGCASILFLLNQKTTNRNSSKLDLFIEYIQANYVDSVDIEDIIENTIYNTLMNLDPHSNYITMNEATSTMAELDGKFEGVGIEFAIYRDTITVVNVVDGGPSKKKGIMPGDRIVLIDDSLVAGVGIENQDVISLLRGERGSSVEISLVSRSQPNIRRIKITRDKIPFNSLDLAYEIAPRVGFIKLNRFSANTYTEFKKELKKLQINHDIDKLILDLRGNNGGYLDQAIKLLNEFFESNKLLVYTKGNARPEQHYMSNSSGSFKNGELVVLIDEGSASASEIVAGAIQDHDRGILVGERTFGKGLVQEQIPFEDGSLLRLTVSRYYTPSGRCIQKPYGESHQDYLSEIYLRNNIDSVSEQDDTSFSTSLGRTVYGGGGITPDSIVSNVDEDFSQVLIHLYTSDFFDNLIFDFVDINRQSLSQTSSSNIFRITNQQKSSLLSEIDQWIINEGASNPSWLFNIDTFTLSHAAIIKRIQALVIRQHWGWSEMQKFLNQSDKVVLTSLSLL